MKCYINTIKHLIKIHEIFCKELRAKELNAFFDMHKIVETKVYKMYKYEMITRDELQSIKELLYCVLIDVINAC